MKTALRIAFHHLTPSAAIEENIRKRIDKLCLLCDRSTGCRVTVEAPPPNRHHHKGADFEVRIEINVPGREIVVHRARRNLAARGIHAKRMSSSRRKAAVQADPARAAMSMRLCETPSTQRAANSRTT